MYLWHHIAGRLVIKVVNLEVKPIQRYVATEWTLVTVFSGVATPMHVEQCTITKNGTTCAYKCRLSLSEMCKNLLIREVGQQMHQVCIWINKTAIISWVCHCTWMFACKHMQTVVEKCVDSMFLYTTIQHRVLQQMRRRPSWAFVTSLE